MAKPKTEVERLLAAFKSLQARLDDIFILEASRSGLGGHDIRTILGIEMGRVTRITKHVKKRE